MDLPTTADVVIIGGGVIGTSIAFHLTRMGCRHVVLCERTRLAAGSTGMSSGLVRMHYDNPLEAELAHKSYPTFAHFDEMVGGECGFVRTGFLRTVRQHNLERLKANVEMLQRLGVKTWLVGPDDIRELAPYLNVDDIPLAAYEPDSGYADPYLTTTGFARAARRKGAHILQGLEVTGIPVRASRVVGVETKAGTIATGTVIIAAGPWGARVAASVGLHLELKLVYHPVVMVETPPQVPHPHLTVIDRLNTIYLRPETGGLTLVGASHDNRVVGPEDLDTYSQTLSPETQFSALERLCNRIPAMEHGRLRKGHAGIITKTADEHALLGPVPGVEGCYAALGFSGHGFKEAPAVGQAMAELVLNGRAQIVDITPLRLTRFAEGRPYHAANEYR
ncbi:MAG: FAD-binding oxidoreductase [Caldilineae bacterium]|nr:MAG: FAD-binding oxidoreductase [Caldilineae bacterium]